MHVRGGACVSPRLALSPYCPDLQGGSDQAAEAAIAAASAALAAAAAPDERFGAAVPLTNFVGGASVENLGAGEDPIAITSVGALGNAFAFPPPAREFTARAPRVSVGVWGVGWPASRL